MWSRRRSRPASDRLRAVSETGVATFDGVDQTTVVWSSVVQITAQMGQQQYDMTRCLLIDSDRQRSIFLPENEALWTPCLTAMTANLPNAAPFEAWDSRLLAQPQATITIYRRVDPKLTNEASPP